MKQVYPAFIVNLNDGSEYPFLVCVPDLKIITEASTFADAIGMGRDAIRVTVKSLKDNNEIIPVPSNQDMAIEKVRKCSEDIDFSKGILTYIDVDFKVIRLKERLEAFYGKSIDEIYVESGEELNKDIKKEELTLDDIFKDYNGEIPLKDDFEWEKSMGAENISSQARSYGIREMYNLIIKLESEGMSAEKIIEIIRFMEEN